MLLIRWMKGMGIMDAWTCFSWRKKKNSQQISYLYNSTEENSEEILSHKSPLVSVDKIEQLKKLISKAEKGEIFLLQGGDCAECFKNCNFSYINKQIVTLDILRKALYFYLEKEIILIGRIAGQYAKPRTSMTETIGDITLPSYFGDFINASDFTLDSRTLKPELMLVGYEKALLTMKYMDRILKCDFQKNSPLKLINNSDKHQKSFNEIFTSHEALLLPYEESLTRKYNDKWYNVSTHFPWIGARTNQFNEAHIEYARGIENPIGVKIGPKTTLENISSIISLLNPNNCSGKLVLIYRFGLKNIDKKLPSLIENIIKYKWNILLMCDPMHGNTEILQSNKTRVLENVICEVKKALLIHNKFGIPLGGIHLEVTGEDVNECVECREIRSGRYRYNKPLVDPRLNWKQALRLIEESFMKIENHCENKKLAGHIEH